MSTQSFGPHLRSLRLRRGVSLDRVSARTNVDVELWEAMERSDFSGWPRGLYARAYLRDYANIVGIDADQIVDEFCRLFPEQGDRRRDSLVRGHAQIVGHRFEPADHPLPAGVKEDRRGTDSRDLRAKPRYSAADLRVIAAILDQAAVLLLASIGTIFSSGHFWMFVSLVAIAYHGVSVALAGCSPCSWAVREFVLRQPQPAGPPKIFSQLRRTIDET